MIATLIAGIALAVAQATPETPSPTPSPIVDSKPAAPAPAESDAPAHIRKALAFEARGLPQGRARELKAALAASPESPIARGLLGLVDYAGTLKSPEEVTAAVKLDAELAAKLAEYNARRDKAPEKAADQYRLALWCKQNGLPDEARAHFTAVTRLKPDDADAWKQLGCKKFNGRWMTSEAVAEAKQEAQAQKLANRQWSTTLSRWKGQLRQKAKREEASAKLNGLEDPRAVPAVWAGFVTPLLADQTLAVQLLGQIDTASATESLAILSVHSQYAEVRRLARETLVIRDPRDYMRTLIAQLHKPMIITGVQRPSRPGESGVLLVEGETFNIRRIYQSSEVTLSERQVQALNSVPGITLEEYQQIRSGSNLQPFGSAPSLVQILARATGDADAAARLLANSSLAGQGAPRTQNPDPYPFLPPQFAPATPLDSADPSLSPSRQPSRQPQSGKEDRPGPGFRQVPPQQFVPIEGSNVRQARNDALFNIAKADRVFISTQRQMSNDVEMISAYNASVDDTNDRAVAVLVGLTKQDHGKAPEAWKTWWADQQGYAYRTTQEPKPTFESVVASETPIFRGLFTGGSCFAAGTMVRTRDGSRPIELIRVGDLVLSQNSRTGSVEYQPVLKVAHNPPAATLKIRLDGGDAIVATLIHRFWKVGKGWRMARELEPGDLLRLHNGTARVAAIVDDKVQPVFNLEVAANHDFFVGRISALVHDDSLVNTVFTPFDADVPRLASAAEAR